MPELILIKHSLPDLDPTVPASQWPLSEAGRLKCKTLSERLAVHHPDVIVASTEPKAMETAQIIATLLGTPCATAEALREHDRRNVGFLSPEQFGAAVARFFESPQDLVLGRETADQAHQRFAAAIEGVIARYPTDTVAVVTHGTVIALFVARATGLDPFPFWRRLGTPAFVVLSLPERHVVAVVENVEGTADR